MEQLQNLKRLREIGQQLLDERKGNLGFGQWDCDTFACWAGHYERSEHAGILSNVFDKYPAFEAHFGLNREQAREIFAAAENYGDPINRPGPAAYDSLEQRMRVLDKLIAGHEPKYQGIPSSVLAWFEQPSVCPV